MRSFRKWAAVTTAAITVALAASACSSSGSSGAGSTATDKGGLTSVNVVEASASPGRLPFYVALYGGFFKKYGLNVNLVESTSGAQSSQLLAGGQVQFEVGQLVDAFNLNLAGQQADAISLLTDKYENSLIVGKKYQGKITNFSQLANQPIGITGVGSGTWQLVEFLAKQGQVPSSQLRMINVGGPAITSGASLISGRVAAQVGAGPSDIKLVDAGQAFFLADPLNLDAGAAKQYPAFVKLATEPYIYNMLYGLKSYVSANPKVAQDMANALQAAENYIFASSSAQVTSLLMKDDQLSPFGQALIQQSVDRIKNSDSLPKTLEIPQVNYANTASFATQLNSKYASITYASLVDNTFAQKAAQTVGTGS